MISSYLPYPLFSGGHIRLFNIIKRLSKNHDITLICEKRNYQTEKDLKEVEKFCKKVVAIERRKQWSFSNIVKAGISFYPFLVVGHTNELLKQAISQVLNNEKFDLIHVETFYVHQNIPPTELPIVVVEHNIEYLVYKRFADKAPVFLRPLLYYDVIKLKRLEEEAWKKAAKLVAVSEQEKSLMKRENVIVVPNGVDTKKYQISNIKYQISKKEKRILFIGDFKWVENRDSVRWIIKDIWPKIKLSFWSEGEARTIESHREKGDAILYRTPSSRVQHDIGLKLWVVGRNIPDSIKKLTTDNSIIFDENAPSDTRLIYQKADMLLSPIRIGGGTSFKILEAMASGVPVVTTSLGNDGIGAREDEEILIAKDDNDFVYKTINLLQDIKLYEKISKNSRKLIEEKFDWDKIVEKLEEVYESVI